MRDETENRENIKHMDCKPQLWWKGELSVMHIKKAMSSKGHDLENSVSKYLQLSVLSKLRKL